MGMSEECAMTQPESDALHREMIKLDVKLDALADEFRSGQRRQDDEISGLRAEMHGSQLLTQEQIEDAVWAGVRRLLSLKRLGVVFGVFIAAAGAVDVMIRLIGAW
jgi:hypothetical protein